MNLLGHGEDSLMREGMRRALADAAPHGSLTGGHESAQVVAARHWSMAGDLGWRSLLVDEEDGGLGLGCDELVALCEELGAHLFCGPWLGTAALYPCLLRLAKHHDIDMHWPGEDAAVSIAARIPAQRGEETRQDAYLGEHPDLATHFLIIDERPAAPGHQRVSWSAVPASSVAVVSRPTSFDPACPLAAIRANWDQDRITVQADERVLAEIMKPFHLAIAAELNGIAAAVLERTLQWVAEREQFNRPVGSFQAIKHQIADDYGGFRKALLATRAGVDADDPGTASIARVLASDAALCACRNYIQHLGAAGISWEFDAHLYLKRAIRLNATSPGTASIRRRNTERFIASLSSCELTADPGKL